MFQIKDLVKTYTPKDAEPVMALRGITVDFGETGMVFILGKSGCGKSTLLHVMGGLDLPPPPRLITPSSHLSPAPFPPYPSSLPFSSLLTSIRRPFSRLTAPLVLRPCGLRKR